jgi:hypothetical protein
MEVTIKLVRHIEVAVQREAKNRGMKVSDLCVALIEVALASTGKFQEGTPIEEIATQRPDLLGE